MLGEGICILHLQVHLAVMKTWIRGNIPGRPYLSMSLNRAAMREKQISG
jgi:hypothetical protein